MAKTTKKLLMGNDAIALGLAQHGCRIALAYPGTPSSEILPALKKWRDTFGMSIYVQWAINEKVAFETAYTASMAGLRAMAAMKQVGLNVASDALMSAAYMGVKGGFIVISADDPGPHSSQTEQDSRLMAMMAKIPVLDPSSPSLAMEMIGLAYEISETYQIPVMLRPTTRVCHGSQDITVIYPPNLETMTSADFKKETTRWAATPKFRYLQHKVLNDKIMELSSYTKTLPLLLNSGAKGGLAIVSSGVASAHLLDLFVESREYRHLTLYQVLQPYPLHRVFVESLVRDYQAALVIEETSPVIQMQIARSDKTKGRMDGFVQNAGELLPEDIENCVRTFAGIGGKGFSIPAGKTDRRPSLCPGCPHRATFYALKKVFASSKSIYTSDIGCYTLGINLRAVDTFICMGGAISQASGLYHSYSLSGVEQPLIAATIGDSTFFHAGIPPLIDAVSSGARFVLLILDNSTTAMTGNQPTPACALDSQGKALVSLEKIIKSCGVKFCKTLDPFDFDALCRALKKARRASESSVAVVIAKAPCLMDKNAKNKRTTAKVRINDKCDGCGYCVKEFECPALRLIKEQKKTVLDYGLCSNCGFCVHVCPKKAIEEISL